MRTRANIHLDNDVYEFASAYASARGLALGAAVSELIRRAEQAQETPSSMLKTNRLGLLVKKKTARRITPQMVKELSEDDLG